VKKKIYKQATTKKETKGENQKTKKQRKQTTRKHHQCMTIKQMKPFINGKYFYMMIQMTIK
jgi:hypothetical protein